MRQSETNQHPGTSDKQLELIIKMILLSKVQISVVATTKKSPLKLIHGGLGLLD